MRLLDKYIIYSSVFALFTEDFSFHYIIDWKLFYLIVITNLSLLSIKNKVFIHKNLIYIILFFLIHGILFFLLFKNPIKSLFVQLIGISICSIFYYSLIKNYTAKKMFDVYLQVALIVAVISIPMFFLNINVFTAGRLNGIMSEPAHYAAIMLPAVYVFLKKKSFLKLSIILLTIMLSRSSIGYLGLALILVLPILKLKLFFKYSFIVLIILCSCFFYLKSVWNKPTDDAGGNVLVRRIKETNESLNSIFSGKFQSHTNLSSYAVLSNSFITTQILINKPFGSGLGAYPYEYDKYYGLMKPPEYLVKLKLSKINRTDASSLFLRMLGDLGFFALIIVLYFIYRGVKVFSVDKKVIEQGSFFYLIIKLIREGHYFPPEFYFFLIIFLKDFNENTAHS